MKHCNTLGCHGNAMEVESYIYNARLGSFKVLTNKVVVANDGKPSPLYEKALCGVIVGAIGATVGSPLDSSLIHMQADATLPAARYEWVLALWQGIGLLASNDIEHGNDFHGLGEASTTMGPNAISRFFASTFSLPFDYAKTQIRRCNLMPMGSIRTPIFGLCHENIEIWRTFKIPH
ncbi:hypothetical protein AAG906_025836 [Vitis piasezkii]